MIFFLLLIPILVPKLETVKQMVSNFDTFFIEMIKNLFTERLRYLIEESDKTQNEICRDLKIRKQKLSKWKTGYNEPSIDEIIMLALYFDVQADYLLGIIDETGKKLQSLEI